MTLRRALVLVTLAAAPARAQTAAPANPAGPAPAAPAPAAAPAPPAHEVQVMDEKDRIELEQSDNVRLSLPTQDDLDAWAGPGLRVQLGYAYGIIRGTGPAFSFTSKGVMLRPVIRVDEHWALAVAMLYGTGPHGVRWSVTAEPTFYLWRQLAFSVGIGYGGLSVSDPNASTGNLRGPDVVVSRDLTEGEKLPSCTGSALSSLARVEYLFVLGPLFATGPFAQANVQWTRCQATFGRTDAETGEPVVLTQWWREQGATFGWWFAWR